MHVIWDFEKCVSVFSQEIATAKKISLIQDSVYQAVMAQEWVDFEWKIAEINQLGNDFILLESQRVELISALNKKFQAGDGSEPSFSELIAGLPVDECRTLTGLYNELKTETLELKACNNNFTIYLNEIKNITTALLEVFLPAKSGKLYNRKGVQTAEDLRSMVLNRRI